MYSDVYDTLDEELSYSNIGGHKGRNILDHLVVLYSIINDVINGIAALWHIFHKSDKELIKKVYDTQKVASTKGDWFETSSKETT